MTEHVSMARMNDALDALLTAAETDALESHILHCSACRDDYARLSETVTALRGLARSATVPDEAWAGIAARIGTEGRAKTGAADAAVVLRLPTGMAPPRSRRLSFSVPQLAAAAVVVSMLSAGTVWMALGAPTGADFPAAEVALEPLGGAAARAVSTRGARYVEVVVELEQILEEGRAVLAPETLVTIEESLTILEAAIEEIRSALARDPNSDLLLRMLANQERTKLGVLRRAVAAVQAQI